MSSDCSRITAVVLAGGFGTRIRHLLPDVPKPMASVAHRPFLEHVVRYTAGFGFRRFLLSTGYLSEVIEAHFARGPVPGVTVLCAREAEPLGTAGGFLNATRADTSSAPEAWLVLNGDSLAFADLGALADALDRGGWDAAILGLRVPDAARYGTLEAAPDGTLLRFSEKRSGAGLINAGVYLFRVSALGHFPPGPRLSFETEVFPALIAAGCRILVHPVEAPFLDIGTPESLAQAEAFILEHGAAHGLPGMVRPS